jgi:hypothetical protein
VHCSCAPLLELFLTSLNLFNQFPPRLSAQHYTLFPSFYHAATYITHPWRIKDGDKTLLEYVGDSATLIINQNGYSQCLDHKAAGTAPFSLSLSFDSKTHGSFRQRGQCAQGIPICAFDCVSKSAIDHAALTLTHMLTDVDQSILHRMLHLGAAIGIIGKDQYTTDIPAHAHLKGQKSTDGRDYDHGTRGLGGSVACPWTTVGEENITMIGDTRYPYESILVHEFAHCVMNVGLAGHPTRRRIQAAYQTAMEKNLYNPSSYLASNEDEYWAEATQAWFEATVRLDATSGMITRNAVKKRDPELAGILTEIWGDGDWRYLQTAPVSEFKRGGSRHGREFTKRFWEKLVFCT